MAFTKCAGPYGSGRLLSSSAAAVVSGYQRCPLAATFCTDEKQTHAEEVVSRRAGHSGAHCLGVLSGLCCLGADTRMVSHQSWLIARVSGFPGHQHSHPTSMTSGGQTEHVELTPHVGRQAGYTAE